VGFFAGHFFFMNVSDTLDSMPYLPLLANCSFLPQISFNCNFAAGSHSHCQLCPTGLLLLQSSKWEHGMTIRTMLAGLLFLMTTQALALQPGELVDNFKLLDHKGKAQELYYNTDVHAVVLLVQGNGCPIVRNAMPALTQLRADYEDKGIRFFLINSNLQDARAATAKEASDFGYSLPILMDETQLIGESLGLDRTGEVLVIGTAEWKLRYRGAIDDRLGYERQKAKASQHYLADALDAIISEQPIELAQTESPGCIINFAHAGEADVSYADSVAPILMDKCVTCHRPGGIGPWAMSSYDMVRGFSPMMREVIRTKRMPPWHADPHYQEFSNDRSLSNEETRTLVHWIEAGSPRGEGEDPLLQQVTQAPEWQLGEPDLVLNIPGYDVPATGVVDYQYLTAVNPLDKDVWVRAAELIPGDRQAVHHVITRFTLGDSANAFNGRARRGGGFGGYVPGTVTAPMPEDVGILLPAGAEFSFQVHYTPYGKATRDESRLGIYFYDEPPKHRMAGTVMINGRFRIPPHASEHSEEASYVFPRDALVYGMLPHAHYRGKAAQYKAVYPDGSEEILLSVPAYDFNWQTGYTYKEPKHMPKGTKVTFTMTWDNSAQNPANPDPGKEVGWGRQSWNEMLFGTLSFRFLDTPGADGVSDLGSAKKPDRVAGLE
jgi:hypothetical protein